MTTRIAICLLLFFVFAESQAADLNPQQQNAKAIFKQLIEIDTTHSSGDTTIAAEALAAHLIAAGLPKEDVKVLAEVPRKGNLIARLRAGKPTNKKPILLMAHLDVVEARREDWSMDPFKFIERDGYYYARGIVDDKAMASIFIANMVRYLKEGYRPNRDIIIALTADEESGTHNGMRWLVKNHFSLVDAAFAINEGGGGQVRSGRKIGNGVQAAEKIVANFELEVTNKGGHSSQPRKDNAIYQLSQALVRLSAYQFPLMLNEVTRGYFEQMSRIESGQAAADFRQILTAAPESGAVARLSDQPMYNSMLRTTCVTTLVQAGHAVNALPQSAKATVNCRMLPGHDPALVERTLREVIADQQIALKRVRDPQPSPASALSREIFGPIEKLTQQMWPGVPVVPMMSTGATDAVPLRGNGVPVYGVSGIFSDIDDVRIHGRDERIEVQAYYDSLEFLYRLVKEYTR